jgi:endonuclease/exonuclease/phosphatase family metal-dependent hydrolase
MGDFNERPWSIALDPIYAPSYERGEGEFVEVDGFDEGRQCRCGSRTLKRKIDYIFLSEDHWGEIWGKVTRTTTESDHRMLHGGGVLMGDG